MTGHSVDSPASRREALADGMRQLLRVELERLGFHAMMYRSGRVCMVRACCALCRARVRLPEVAADVSEDVLRSDTALQRFLGDWLADVERALAVHRCRIELDTTGKAATP